MRRTDNRPAAPDALRKDIESALALLIDEPGIGTNVEIPRPDVVRRLHHGRIRDFVYYRVRGRFLEVIAFWHTSRGSQPPF